jgi:hypothetical protein
MEIDKDLEMEHNEEIDYIKKYFENRKIKVETDGYNYFFNYKNKGIHFCTQTNRIVGQIYSEKLNLGNTFSLAEYHKKEKKLKEKGYKRICLGGFLDEILPNLERIILKKP